MSADHYYLALAFTVIATVPLLVGLVRSITAPWRLLAKHYPGPSTACRNEVSYVTARFWGTFLSFPLTRCIRIRSSEESLAFSVIGLDFLLAKLPEIVVPRNAITECAACDFVLPRQKLEFEGAPTTVVIYGRGARFIRSWWKGGSK